MELASLRPEMDEKQADWFVHELGKLAVGIRQTLDRSTEVGKDLHEHFRVKGGSRAEATDITVRLEVETHHLLVDVAGVEKIALAVNRRTGDHRIRDALERFNATAQDARDFRDFYEHLDRYILETGNLTTVAPWPYQVEFAFGADGDITYVVHGHPDRFVSLGGAGTAALELAQVVVVVLRGRLLK